MSVIALYAINQHLDALRSEASDARLAREATSGQPKRSVRRRLADFLRDVHDRLTPGNVPGIGLARP